MLKTFPPKGVRLKRISYGCAAGGMLNADADPTFSQAIFN